MRFACTYGAGRYAVDVDPGDSPYSGKYPGFRELEMLPYYSTVDDPVIGQVASQLLDRLGGRDDRIKIAVALSFVQQNVEYRSDMEIYDLDDVWGLPVVTLARGTGDCDCMANLCTSIMHNMGIDVVSVITRDHMFSAACFDGGHGVSYEYRGRRYYHLETTSDLPVSGRYWSYDADHWVAAPEVPTEAFVSRLSDLG